MEYSTNINLKLFVAWLLISATPEVMGQDRAEFFDATDILVNPTPLEYVKGHVMPLFGDVEDVRVMGIVFGSDVKDCRAFAIRMVFPEKVFGVERSVLRYEITIYDGQANGLTTQRVSTEVVEEIISKWFLFFWNSSRTSQSENLAHMTGLDAEIHCYVFLRRLPVSRLIGGKIFNPRPKTESEDILRKVQSIIAGEQQ